MFNVIKFAFRITVGLLGLAWQAIEALLGCVPDSSTEERSWVYRSEVDEPPSADVTVDGRLIVD
ncbi:MAG: hypothetical protein JF606_26655 [Burkholderiales bacterium]|nr:hypothetical protein [Burkholderiales bacterium]